MDDFSTYLGITPIAAISIVASAIVLYAVMAVVLRLWGRRLAVSASTVSVAIITLIAAISARSILGDSPTLLGGLVAIATLLVLELVFGQWGTVLALRGAARWARSPVVLMVGDRVRGDALRKQGVTRAQLWSRLRQAGILHPGDVGLVILEPRGAFSIIPAGRLLDREMLAGVEGLDEVPAAWFAGMPEE